MMEMTPDAPCPCRVGQEEQPGYRDCCGPWHAGREDRSALPPTAEALMRSRYSAFVLQLADYLLETWHESTRPRSMELDASTRWLGLSIVRTRAGGAQASRGVVEFRAGYRCQGFEGEQHETSTFVREAGAWYYVDAI